MSREDRGSRAIAYSKMLSVLYRLLFLAMISYWSTMGGMGRPSLRISVALGCVVVGGRKVFLRMATVTPVEPRFFCAPKKRRE